MKTYRYQTNERCVLCGYDGVDKISSPSNHFNTSLFKCPICGWYEVSFVNKVLDTVDRNRLLSYLFFNKYSLVNSYGIVKHYHSTADQVDDKEKRILYGEGATPRYISKQDVDNWYPYLFSEKIDLILLNLHRRSRHMGSEIKFQNIMDYIRTMMVDCYESMADKWEIREEKDMLGDADYMMEYFIQQKYVSLRYAAGKITADSLFRIMPEGYARIDALGKDIEVSKKAFVAMKFKDTNELREAIKKGVSDAGYEAVLIDEVEYNDLITPEILHQIKESKFVVVEVTHGNNGAYFEGGYAMGIGKPMIQLCKRGTEIHFDTSQWNTIIWDNTAEIADRLTKRIEATIQ